METIKNIIDNIDQYAYNRFDEQELKMFEEYYDFKHKSLFFKKENLRLLVYTFLVMVKQNYLHLTNIDVDKLLKNIISNDSTIFNNYIEKKYNNNFDLIKSNMKYFYPDFDKIKPVAKELSEHKETIGVKTGLNLAKYEYKIVIIYMDSKDAENDLNELGENGWELISIMTNMGTSSNKLVFKRVKLS